MVWDNSKFSAARVSMCDAGASPEFGRNQARCTEEEEHAPYLICWADAPEFEMPRQKTCTVMSATGQPLRESSQLLALP